MVRLVSLTIFLDGAANMRSCPTRAEGDEKWRSAGAESCRHASVSARLIFAERLDRSTWLPSTRLTRS
eukprot:1054251-Prymnesium_polylepis.1